MSDIDLRGVRIGLGVTGSFCTFEQILPMLERLVALGAAVTPIFSYATSQWDTRFFTASAFRERVEGLAVPVLTTVPQVEPIGPKKLLDIMLIAPCTGNTLAKLVHGIVDTPVVMAAKSMLRNNRPVVVAVSTNDALGNNAENIGQLMNMRNLFFVPFGQDDLVGKPRSMTADFMQAPEALALALSNEQIQPMLLSGGMRG